MPRRIAQSAPEKAASITENLRIRGDGDAVLTGKNEADNPGIDRFGQNGVPEGMVLSSPLEETGTGVYIKGPGQTVMTEQGSFGLSDGQWEQRFPLIVGSSLPSLGNTGRVSAYAAPALLEAVDASNAGLTGGWHGVTYAHAIEARTAGTLLITQIAPLYVLEIPQGNGLRINWDISISEQITHIVIGLTPPYATEEEAVNSSEVWLQQVVSTRPRIPALTDVWGPYNRTRRLSFLSVSNETGINGIPPAPKTSSTSSTLPAWTPKLAYSLWTVMGQSLSSAIASKNLEMQKVTWWPPTTPAQATSWQPEYLDSEGNWRAMSRRDFSVKASLSTNDPSLIDAKNKLQVSRNAVNTTEIEGPDSALSLVSPIGQTLPPPGDFEVRLTRIGIDPTTGRTEQSPAGPIAKITLLENEILRIRPPSSNGNFMPNSEATQLSNTGNIPEGWERPAVTGVAFEDDVPGIQTIIDVSGEVSSTEVSRSPWARVNPTEKSVMALELDMADYVGGRVDVILRERNSSGTPTDFVVGTYSTDDPQKFIIRLSPSGTSHAQDATNPYYANVVLAPDTTDVRLVLRNNGASAAGARSLTYSLYNLGIFLGHAVPHKRVPVDPVSHAPSPYRNASLAEEDPATPYPGSGYTMTILEAPDSMRAVGDDGNPIPGNIIEYYGPPGTPVTSAFFMGGMRLAVKPEEQRTVSTYLYWNGVSSPSVPFRALVKNRNGEVVGDPGVFNFSGQESLTGDSWDNAGAGENGYVRGSVTFIVPADGAYVEISSGGVGDGLFRVMGFQFEHGSQPTAFNDDYAIIGSIVSTFDMSIPGVPQGELETFTDIMEITGIAADVTHIIDDNGIPITSHSVQARIKPYDAADYGPWTSNPEELEIPKYGYATVQLGTILSTSDINQTPVLHSHYVEFMRVPRGSENGNVVGSFCRADGTEFDGTALVYDVPVIKPEKPIFVEDLANNRQGFAIMGDTIKWLRGFGIECALESTAREIMELLGEGLESDDEDQNDASTFTLWIQRKNLQVRILDMDIKPTSREAYDPILGMEEEGRWVFAATGLEGEVIDEGVF